MTAAKGGWTFDTLLVHLERMIETNDRRYEQRFKDSQVAVDAALNAAKEAVQKAEAASEKRFEGVNELRAMATDQQRTFMPRSEAENLLKAMDTQIDELKRARDNRESIRTGGREMWAYIVAVVGVLFGVATLALRFVKP